MAHTTHCPDRGTMTTEKNVMWTWWLPYLAGWGVFLAVEINRHGADFGAGQTPVEWFLNAKIDALVFLVLLATAPLCWWLAGNELLRRGSPLDQIARRIGAFFSSPVNWMTCPAHGLLRPLFCSFLVGIVSLAASAAVGAKFDSLPPAYHDEYSYLFQAETFLAGRVSFPSHEAARLFDQMHVLNEGRFASRYFPGAGAWMAPFVAAGHPYWGHWLAGAIASILMFWIGKELHGDAAGLFAGLLTALSPGMALFSNLLLAHHPTLVGLGVFIYASFQMLRGTSARWGLAAGVGLAFAMLCRPMTAAGVAFPFGVYFVWWAWRMLKGGGEVKVDKSEQAPPVPGEDPCPPPLYRTPGIGQPRAVLALAALGTPLIAAGIGLFFYDRAITGDGWTTPYSLYTEIYTPRHRYGFDNVRIGEQHLGSRVIENYDKWAENLTPAMAASNVVTRWSASWRWSLGILPLTLALAGGLTLWRRLPRGAWLILAAIVSLHAVHVPYWFVGMEDHHYVFEAGPLWMVWTAVVSVAAVRAWRTSGRQVVGCWWSAFLASAVVMNFAVSGGTWSSPFEQGINRVSFARQKHGRFAELVAREANPRPALVLVEHDPADRHIEYVTNAPDLSGPVLIGHYLPVAVPMAEVRRLFPDRTLFLYRVRENEWKRIKK